MANALDLFARGDGALGTAPTGQVWSVVRGTVTLVGGRLRALRDNPGSFAVMDLGAGGQDGTFQGALVGSGGQALYFRVTDANNWWRFALDQYLQPYQYYTGRTNYSWRQLYYNNDGSNGSAIYLIGPYDGSAPSFPATNNGAPAQGAPENYASSPEEATGYTVAYRLQLNKCVAGVLTTFSAPDITAAVNSAGLPTYLRVVALGNSIKTYTSLSSAAQHDIVDATFSTATKVGQGSYEGSAQGTTYAEWEDFSAALANSAPLAPTGLTPSGGASIERLNAQRLSWVFGDTDTGDTQTKADIQWRIGAGAWNTISAAALANQFYDAPASTFPAGSVEWQVRTYDSQGVVGPWSASAFFTSATTPGVPTITAPASGGTISASPSTVTWNAAAQESYQVRRVADNAGVPDTATVYSDTGEVVSAGTRNEPVAFPVNNRYEHVQVRVKVSGLWSTWASVRVQVAFTPPLNPLLVAIAIMGAAAIQVSPTNPVGNLLTPNQASIETDASGWQVGGNCTIVRSTAQGVDGPASLAITATAAGAAEAFAGFIPVVPLQVYTGVASFRAATTGRQVQVYINWYDAAGVFLVQVMGRLTGDNASGWQQATVTGRVPANATQARLYLRIPAMGGAGEVHYADQAGLFPDPTGNLFPNPSLEGDSSQFALTNGNTNTLTTALSWTGRTSQQTEWNGTSSASSRYSGTVALPAGTYTVTARIYVPSGTSPNPYLFASADGGNVQAPAITLRDQWVTQSLVVTVLAQGGWNYFDVRTAGARAAGMYFYIDGVQINVGNVAQPWSGIGGQNLILSPSYELDLWTITGGTLAASTDAVFGTRSAAATVTATGTTMAISTGASGVGGAKLLPSTTYTSSMYVKAPRAMNVRIRQRLYDDQGASAAVTTIDAITAVPAGVWTRITNTFTTGADVAYGMSQMLVASADAVLGEVYYVDAAQLEYGTNAGPYIDGSLGAGYVWEAAENLLTGAQSNMESTNEWVASSNASGLALSTAQKWEGAQSLTFSATAAGSLRVRTSTAARFIALAGVPITLSAYLRCGTTARSFSVGAVFYDSAGAAIGTFVDGPAMPAVTTAWARATATLIPPANAVSAYITVLVIGAALGDVFYLDGVQVEQKDHATAYGQAATAHSASSRRQFPWAMSPAAVVSNDIYRRVGGVGAGIRVAKALAPSTVWTDYTPASGVDYQYLVRATGANGTTADSAWV